MNCKHVQELLPLYVGGDLEERRAMRLATHVESCPECAGAADEYRESLRLLQLFAPPPFSEGVYTGIRQRVLREIERESTSPAPPQLIASLFRPRIRWAVASALLLAVSVCAFYFVANRQNDRQQLAGSDPSVDRTTQDKKSTSQGNESGASVSPSPSSKEDEGQRTSIGRKPVLNTAITGPVNRIHQSRQGKRRGVAADRLPSLAVNTPDTRSMTAEASPEVGNPAQPAAVLNRDPATSARIMRMEVQTKDPNIRIIWFTPQRTKQNSPGKSSKDNHEVRSYA